METLLRPPLDPDFPQIFALNYERPDELFGNEDYLRIGDAAFSIPPTSIQIHSLTDNRPDPMVRTPGGEVKSNGITRKEIRFTLVFHGTEDIFGLPNEAEAIDIAERAIDGTVFLKSPEINPNSLAALAAMFKVTPVVPVVNRMLNIVHDIHAVTLESLVCETAMGDDGKPIPNCITATIQLCAFDWQTYMPAVPHLDSAMIYPLFRWHWRQQFAEILPGQYHIAALGGEPPAYPALQPAELASLNETGDLQIFKRYAHQTGMSADFQFLQISQDWLDQLNSLRATFNKMQAYLLSDEFRTQVSDPDKKLYIEDVQSVLNRMNELSKEDNARYVPVDLGEDLILTHLSVGIENTFSNQVVPSIEIPVAQHMGQGDVRLVATFIAMNDAAVAGLEHMISDARRIAREQRFEMIAGFMGFENELSSLFGVRQVVFTDIKAQNLDRIPGAYLVSVEMIAFNRHQQRYEALQKAKDVPYYMLEQNPIPLNGEQGPSDAADDPRYVFWQRLLLKQAAAGDASQAQESAFDPMGNPITPWFNMAYIQQAKEQLAYLELYPDLHLPTFERLELALTSGEIFEVDSAAATVHLAVQKMRYQEWSNEGRFVDPDFYVDYPNATLAQQLDITNIDYDAPGGAGDASSYLKVLVDKLNGLENTLAMIDVQGSLRSHAGEALWDEYPDGQLLGPRANVPQHPDDDIMPARGNTHVHGTIKMPHPTHTTGTHLITPTFTAPASLITTKVDGKPVQIPAPSEAFDTTWRDDPNAIHKIEGGTQAAKDSTAAIFGTADDGRDNTPELCQALYSHHPIDIGTSVNDEHGRLVGVLAKLFDHDKTGRLIQAYPSYCMQLIDEGPRMNWVKLFPNFYALQAVRSFSVCTDRRDPASTLEMELANSYGSLSSYTQAQLNTNAISALTNRENGLEYTLGDLMTGRLDRMRNDISYMLDGATMLIRQLFPNSGLTDSIAALRAKQSSTVMLQPGTRIHLRVGYGSNAGQLPVVFNGTITDVGYGERVEVIALGDGQELNHLIPSADNQTNTVNRPQQGFLQNGQAIPFTATSYEPRELIQHMLASHGESLFDYNLGHQFWNSVKRFLYQSTNGGVFADNPIGISHFGNPYLFSLWDGIAKRGPGAGDPRAVLALGDPGTVEFPQPLTVYQKSKAIIGNSKLSFSEKLMAGSKILVSNWADILTGSAGMDALIEGGTDMQNSGDPLGAVTGFAAKMIGEGGALFWHWLPTGFGECGENVYPIYTPFDQMCKNFGTVFSKQFGEKFANEGLGAGALDAANTLTADSQPDPPDTTPNTLHWQVGPLQRPGCAFNMYTYNKTAWDVISFMAQCFPPYVAAVRPFEYRSTLFYGAPYWGFRHDYRRVSAEDLGQFKSDQNDMYYGYPVGYKVQPFMQFHVFDSRLNLLSNDVRASDEDTYTDVIAMWYGGQGYSQTRPTPMAQHQTVDRAIMSSMRKSVIVNTDYVGLDTAPSFAAVVGSFGTAYIGYAASHLTIPFTQIGINGGLNHWVAEKNMRHTARAILRDYQKLMYQGAFMVLGDPTIWPHDINFLNDEYTDMHGLCGTRRVIHHFGFDTGFVTSVEPDLVTEVKGENYLTSMLTWLGGYLGTGIVGRWAAEYLAARGRRKAITALGRFGLKLTKRSGLFERFARGVMSAADLGKSGQWGALLKGGMKFGGKPVEMWQPRPLLYWMRNLFLDGVTKTLQKDADFKSMSKDIAEIIRASTKDIHGKKALDDNTKWKIVTEIDKSFTDTLERDGAKMFADESSAELREAVQMSLAGVGKVSPEKMAARAMATFIVKRWQTNYLFNSRGLSSIVGDQVRAVMKAAIEKSLGVGVKLSAAALRRMGATAVADLLPKVLPLLVRGAVVAELCDPVGWVFQLTVGWLWDSLSTWWDDDTSLMICPMTYRGAEMTAGINGHQDSIILRTPDETAPTFALTHDELQQLHDLGIISISPEMQRLAQANAGMQMTAEGSDGTSASNVPQKVWESVSPPTSPITGGPVSKYTSEQRAQILAPHTFSGSTDKADLLDPNITKDELIGLFDHWNKAGITVTTSAVHSDHNHGQPEGGDTWTSHGHTAGWAVDIVGVNGVPVSADGLKPEHLQAIGQGIAYAHIHQIGVDQSIVPSSPFAFTQGDGAYEYTVQQGIQIFKDLGTGPHLHFGTTEGRG